MKMQFKNNSKKSSWYRKFDRKHRFRLNRSLGSVGFEFYRLINEANGESLHIERYLFDRFRSGVVEVQRLLKVGSPEKAPTTKKPNSIDIKVEFKGQTFFKIAVGGVDPDRLIIAPISGAVGQIVQGELEYEGNFGVATEALSTLEELLFCDDLDHPNDVLGRIISYHRLFQASFVPGSESITSDLSLRKNFLSSYEPFVPVLGRGQLKLSNQISTSPATTPKPSTGAGEDGDADRNFQSKLADRDLEAGYQVDYGLLFNKGTNRQLQHGKTLPKSDKNRPTKKVGDWFPLNFATGEVKSFGSGVFKSEHTTAEMESLRTDFLGGRDNDLYLGFEIIDAVHRSSSGRLRSFRFPLYYMPVEVQESGRNLYLHSKEGNRFYLNHLGLANLVTNFSSVKPGQDPIDAFFKTLLAQKIAVHDRFGRIYISRCLPCDDEVFKATREVLLGQPNENGQGGILAGLKIEGIECDLVRCSLYRSAKNHAPLPAALEADLSQIESIAHQNPRAYGSSLLGRFMNPGRTPSRSSTIVNKGNGSQTNDFVGSDGESARPFSSRIMIPGALPASTGKLLRHLDRHDLVLLEGPPGTGKTFTIMNMVIHCLCTGKRLLVVSDQVAATHALTEKIQEYLLGRDRESAQAKNLDNLWRTAVKLVDDIPSAGEDLGAWIVSLSKMLRTDLVKDVAWPKVPEDALSSVASIDEEISELKHQMAGKLTRRTGDSGQSKRQVAQKHHHDTTVQDIESLVQFVDFFELAKEATSRNEPRDRIIRRFVEHRYKLLSELSNSQYPNLSRLYRVQRPPLKVTSTHLREQYRLVRRLRSIAANLPRSFADLLPLLNGIEGTAIASALRGQWRKTFDEDSSVIVRYWRIARSLVSHPNKLLVHFLLEISEHQLQVLKLYSTCSKGVWHQLITLHDGLKSRSSGDMPSVLEIVERNLRINVERPKTKQGSEAPQGTVSIQDMLSRMKDIQAQRDKLISEVFRGRLGEIAADLFTVKEHQNTSVMTTIANQLEAIKSRTTIETAGPLIADLQKTLLEAFPLWIARKQTVPFLFPTEAESFDLVIVDEATQCRVDDSLPLLYRAKKLMVVGDEKQTVLAKQSVIDDYLFAEFNLEEHLRSTQARAFKGGGSHIFGLVKSIKQASLMLDEHYRCPPDIIEYSNRYVYGSELKTMQWLPPNQPSPVSIDWSERQRSTSGRQQSGRYKGLETAMLDRYLDWVAKEIEAIEQASGRRVNVSTDVALCYFLLKNESYIKDVKTEWLRKLGRGSDVLDGAGAALQGKERDYIFYLWDVNRGNFNSFRQGDEEDKRKGELNVLMSRPKKRAFHYLHKDFGRLDHHRASITDFLWQRLNNSSESVDIKAFEPRRIRPPKDFRPWRRGSGQLIERLLTNTLQTNRADLAKELGLHWHSQQGVVVGDSARKIDLMLSVDLPGGMTKNIAIIDLMSFEFEENVTEQITNYFFQLQRATPKITPIFAFLHELIDCRTKAMRLFIQAMESVRNGPGK